MRASLRGSAVLFALTAAIAIGGETGRADEKATVQGLHVSWDGRGEIRLVPDGDGEFSLRLRLEGNVVIEGERFDAKADRLIYHMATKVVSLESSPDSAAQLSFKMPDDGPTLRLVARKIVISLSDGRIKVDGAGWLSTPAEKPPKPAPQGDVP